jgi:hypothetical protein
MANLRYAVVAALALFAQAFGASHGDAQAADQAPANDDRVVVTGKQAEEAIRDFVGRVAVASRAENQLARWNRRVCPGMVGLRPSYTQLVLDQIARRAVDVGLGVGDPGCAANIIIIVSMDPDAIARGLLDNYKRRLGYYQETGVRTRGRSAMKAFVESPAPVRWWHVNNTLTADGKKPSQPVNPASFNKLDQVPIVSLGSSGTSLAARTTRQDFALALVVVDGRRLQGVSLTALADYLAMASLAQVDPGADTSSYRSVLNLFNQSSDGRPAPAAMTDWDIAYLRGVYDMTREASSASSQQREIARTMSKELLPPQ